MKVGFLLQWHGETATYVMADNLLRSIRRAMPGTIVVQLTDGDSPAVHGVDIVRRFNCNTGFALWCADHYAQLEGDWLLVDTDTQVNRDVLSVFDKPFDVALTTREGTLLPGEQDSAFVQDMPHNIGVVFSRSPEFWRRVAAKCRTYPQDKQNWMGNQHAVADLMRDGGFDGLQVIEVPGDQYNYPPQSAGEDVSTRAIVHWKGPRKTWLIDRIRRATTIPSTPQPVGEYVGPLRVFIGYDSRQPIAFHVAAHSVMARSSVPVTITPLCLNQLPITRRGLTEFTYSRFLVPWLCGFKGRAVFLDSDVLCLGDVAELAKLGKETNAAVAYVSHDWQFERPSVMVFDCVKCGALSPAYVNNPANNLFEFGWAPSAGSLPGIWNFLVGYDAVVDTAPKLIHFTQGIPVWPETGGQDYTKEWLAEREATVYTTTFQDLMGQSVHPLANAVQV